MVLPLIPLALLALGGASGAGGVALGGKGAHEIKTSRDAMNQAAARYEGERLLTEGEVERTNALLAALGERQREALDSVVLRMGEFLRRNAKKVKESERLLVDGIDVTVGAVGSSDGLDVDALSWVRGMIGSVGVGAGVGAGVTGAATTFGVASTGAAISGLSGAAAESATLALLGGGSLASGGGGMALGATVLNVVAVGPALLVGGFVIKGQGDKALTRAREHEARVNVAIGELSDTRARLGAVDQRTDEIQDLLARLRDRAVVALDVLESEDFDPEAHVERFQTALNYVMAVRDVCATPVVDGAGTLNDKTEGFTVKYKPMTEESTDD